LAQGQFAQPQTRDLLVVLNPNKAKAQAALKAINSGQSWKSVAKKYSTDSASKAQGGKLPNVTKGQQEKGFDTAIFSAPKNKVQGPVKTQFGYYVFKVTKDTPAKQQTLAQVHDTIKNLLQSQNQQKALNDFVTSFQKDYKAKTNCAKGYVVDQCKNAPKPKSATQPLNGGSPQTGAPQQGAPQQVPQGAPQQVPQGTPQAPQQGAPSQPTP